MIEKESDFYILCRNNVMDLNLDSVFLILETKTLSIPTAHLHSQGRFYNWTCWLSHFCVYALWKLSGASECSLFSSVPIHPGEIKRGRIGWAEISVGGALDCRLFHDPHTSGPCCDTWFFSSSVETNGAQSPLWDVNRWKEMKQLVWFYPIQVRFFVVIMQH